MARASVVFTTHGSGPDGPDGPSINYIKVTDISYIDVYWIESEQDWYMAIMPNIIVKRFATRNEAIAEAELWRQRIEDAS